MMDGEEKGELQQWADGWSPLSFVQREGVRG